MIGLFAAFTLGLVGSLHCIGMCGPLALALPRGNASNGRFVAGRVLYQLGRVTTYTFLGLMFGLIGGAARLAGAQQVLSISLGAAILLWLVLPKRLTARIAAGRRIAPIFAHLKSILSALMRSKVLFAQFGVVLLNGLLPCGMIYVALAAALAQPSLIESAAFMTLFGLGTVPAMLALSIAPTFISNHTRISLRRLMPVGTAVIAVLLIVRGLALGIPYLSPKTPTSFTQAAVPSCHHH